MEKSVIDLNVDRAVSSLNDSFDFNGAKTHILRALDEVGSNKKLAYYDVLRSVITKLHYNVRGISKKLKVKKCYSSLLHFYQTEFAEIAHAEINPDSTDEMMVCNSICCDIVNSVTSFMKGIRHLYMDLGIITSLINNKKYLNEFMPIGLKIEKAARDVLKQYNNKTSNIIENIRIWDNEVNGKYGAKYL